MLKNTSYKHNHRYVEAYLPEQKPLYLIGHLDTRHHFTSEKEVKQHMAKVISEWKLNPSKMLHRFDLDRNGEIGQEEWEKARAQAREDVLSAVLHKAHTVSFEISAPTNGQLYLLSGMSPDYLRKRHQHWVMLHLAVLTSILITLRLL